MTTFRLVTEFKTAPSSEKLAVELDKLQLKNMAKKARENFYHDYFSGEATPCIALANELWAATEACPDGKRQQEILALRNRHLNGEFDATLAESDEWANSDDGKAAITQITRGK